MLVSPATVTRVNGDDFCAHDEPAARPKPTTRETVNQDFLGDCRFEYAALEDEHFMFSSPFQNVKLISDLRHCVSGIVPHAGSFTHF
jgi:hypothetical protein